MNRALPAVLVLIAIAAPSLAKDPVNVVWGAGSLALGTALVQETESGAFPRALSGLSNGDFLAADGPRVQRWSPETTLRWELDTGLAGAAFHAREVPGALNVFFQDGLEEFVAVLSPAGELLRVVEGLRGDASAYTAADADATYGATFDKAGASRITAWASDGSARWAFPLPFQQVALDVASLGDGRAAAVVLTEGPGSLDLRIFDRDGRIAEVWPLADGEFQLDAIGGDTASMAPDGAGGLLVGWTTAQQTSVNVAWLRDHQLAQGHAQFTRGWGPIAGLALGGSANGEPALFVFGTLTTNAIDFHAALAKFPVGCAGCGPPAPPLWVRELVGLPRSTALAGVEEDGRLHVVHVSGCVYPLEPACPVPSGSTWRTTLHEIL